MLKNYLKIALRNFLKYKLNSFINIFGLTLGIASCLVLLIFVDYESSFDSEHSLSTSTYRVVQHQKFPEETYYFNTTPYPLANALRNDFSQFKSVTQILGLTSRTIGVDKIDGSRSLFKESNVLYVDSFYTNVFDKIEWLAGNKNAALHNSNEVILTESIAIKYFDIKNSNYESIIGKSVFLNNETPLLVIGVVKNTSGNSNYQFGILLPYNLFAKKYQKYATNWSVNHQGTTFVVLNDVSQKSALEAELKLWKTKYLSPDEASKIDYKLQPLSEVHTDSLYGSNPGGYIMPSKSLIIGYIVAFFILGIAIINFVNLITAQSSVRYKEVGVLKVLGSQRINLILQFVIENSLLIFTSVVLSIILVHLAFESLNEALTIIKLDLKLQWNHFYTVAIIFLFTVVLASFYPAFVLSSFNPVQALKGKLITNNPKGLTIRKSLIVFQFAIVQVFVIAVVIIGLQMSYFNTKSIGFSTESVVITPIPNFDKLDIFKNKLLKEKQISEVSFGSGPPMGIDGLSLGTSFRLPQNTTEEGKYAEIKVGDVNYLNFYNLKLIAGKNFTSSSNNFNQFIINETLLKAYGWSPEEAIGKQLAINEGKATIVGVVKDYHNNALQYDITPSIILNWNSFKKSAFIKVNTINSSSISNIEAIWKDTFKSSVYSFSLLDDAIEREYVVERLVFKGFSILSVLAVCIGCLGLFGLMAFILMTKSKEIAIRKVLGSNITQIVTFLSKEFLILIIIAFVIATPVAYYFMKSWLKGFSYRINLSIWIFIIGGIITLGLALITCSYQSLKVAFSNPIKNLRTE